MPLHHSKLSIQNSIENLAEVEACASKVAELIGFNDHDNKQVQLAIEEALSNIIKYSFSPGQSEFIDIEFCQEALGLQVNIWVKGIPFDPALFPVYSRETLETKLDDRGLGNFLIRQVMDELSYINHGHGGIEIVMKKSLPAASIEQMISQDEAATEHKDCEEGQKPSFTTALMKEEEAVEVSKLAYFSYGYTYPFENIYYPDRVARLIQSGQLISMVARLQCGQIIGHSGLEIERGTPTNAELGIAFSNPAFRGMGILNKLWEELIKKATDIRALGVYAMAVTSHPFSQKAAHHFDMQDCCLYLSKVPVLKFKNISEGSQGRESIMVAYKYLNPPEEITIYPPANHDGMISSILHKLSLRFTAEKPEEAPDKLEGTKSKIVIKVNTEFVTADIQLDQYGEDVINKVEQVLKRLCVERYETIYLCLPLNDENTAFHSPMFEKMGFFFSGLMPKDKDTVFLVLQYLNNQMIDYDQIELDSEFGRDLKEYIKECDPNIKDHTILD